MSFEFTDPAEAAAKQAQQAPQIPQGAGVLPAGAQQPPEMPAGLSQGQPPGAMGQVFGGMAGGADQFGQGPDSSMFTDDQLAALAGEDGGVDPIAMQADEMEAGLDQGDPELQMRMMEAARRMGGF